MLRRRLHVWHADLQGIPASVRPKSAFVRGTNQTLMGLYVCAGDHCGVAPNRFFHFVASPTFDLFLLQLSLPRFLPFVEHEI
jgi:hypothetical protein